MKSKIIIIVLIVIGLLSVIFGVIKYTNSYVYRITDNNTAVGDKISNLGEVYSDSTEAEKGKVFLRHKVLSNTVKDNEIGFVFGKKTYYLIGKGSNYEKNKKLLSKLFGYRNCNDISDTKSKKKTVSCYNDVYSIVLDDTGNIQVQSLENGRICSISDSTDEKKVAYCTAN